MVNKSSLNELALFAGAGGGILGGKLLGWQTVCAVEWEPYPASVLCARQNDAILTPFPIWDDIQTFDGKPWRGIVDVVSGGFPCQDISAAGKGAGIDGERSGMWRHMARVVGEVRPRYVFVENSPMLVNRGLSRVLGDLTEIGYDTRWLVMGAADVGAPHRRDRIWILGTDTSFKRCDIGGGDREERHPLHNINGNAKKGESERERRFSGIRTTGADVANADSLRKLQPQGSKQDERGWISDGSEELANSTCHGLETKGAEQQTAGTGGKSQVLDYTNCAQRQRNECSKRTQEKYTNIDRPSELADTKSVYVQGQYSRPWEVQFGRESWWEVEPNVGRVADGVAARVDRLKAIGNGQVPLCAAEAWRILTWSDY